MKKKYQPKRTPPQICWRCGKALGGCCWSRSFKPVPGWEAEPTTLMRGAPSYRIIRCPEYEPDWDPRWQRIHKKEGGDLEGGMEDMLRRRLEAICRGGG